MPYISPPYEELYLEKIKLDPSHEKDLSLVSIIHTTAAVAEFNVGVYNASITAPSSPSHAAWINSNLLSTEECQT